MDMGPKFPEDPKTVISDVMPVSEVVDGGVDDDEDLVVAVNLKITVNKLHIILLLQILRLVLSRSSDNHEE